MSVAHYMTSGMGGIRTSGDLVARMELGKSMRINDAKKYVADKLGIDVWDLSDVTVMRELREKEDIGLVTGLPGAARGLVAKLNIEKLLDIKINSCEVIRQRFGL